MFRMFTLNSCTVKEHLGMRQYTRTIHTHTHTTVARPIDIFEAR